MIDIEEMYVTYHQPVFRYAYRLVGNIEQAEDIAQETFVKIVKALPSLSSGDSLSSWIYRIAHNAATDVIRRRMKVQFHSIDALGFDCFAGNDEPESFYQGDNEAVRIALQRLTEKDRKALYLFYVYGVSMSELAALYQLNHGGAKMMLQRARNRFRREYDDLSR